MPRNDFLNGLSEEMKGRHAIFASNLIEARHVRGWSQVEAAKRCLVSLKAYRAAEEGNLGTAIGVYWAILDGFGIGGVEDLAAPHKDEEGRLLRERKRKKKGDSL